MSETARPPSTWRSGSLSRPVAEDLSAAAITIGACGSTGAGITLTSDATAAGVAERVFAGRRLVAALIDDTYANAASVRTVAAARPRTVRRGARYAPR